MSIRTCLQHADFESEESSAVEPGIVWTMIEQVHWPRELAKAEGMKEHCPPNFGIYRDEGGTEHWLFVEFYAADEIAVRVGVHYPAKLFGLIPKQGEKEIYRDVKTLADAKPLVDKFLSLPAEDLVRQVRGEAF